MARTVAIVGVPTSVGALALLEPRCERLLVHFDVDVVDFTDTPLSDHANKGAGAIERLVSAVAEMPAVEVAA